MLRSGDKEGTNSSRKQLSVSGSGIEGADSPPGKADGLANQNSNEDVSLDQIEFEL